MPAMFDPDLYATVPTRTTGAMLSLARGLLSAAASEPEARVAKRLAKLRKAAKLLQAAWVEAGRPAPGGHVRFALEPTPSPPRRAARSRHSGRSASSPGPAAPRARSPGSRSRRPSRRACDRETGHDPEGSPRRLMLATSTSSRRRC